MAEEYQNEDWVSLYHSALVELEQAKMLGRIKAAQRSILDRVEKLRIIPGLHPQEYHAIDDALRALRFLAAEEARFDEEAERRMIDETLARFRSFAPVIKRVSKDTEPE